MDTRHPLVNDANPPTVPRTAMPKRNRYFRRFARLKKPTGMARDAGIVSLGAAGGQALLILSAPVLTRLYSPAELGSLAIFGAGLSLLLVVASLRYELAIPIARQERTALSVLGLSLALCVASAVLVAVLLSSGGGVLARWLGVGGLTWTRWLLPLGLLAAGINQALTYWAIRERRYVVIARTRVSQAGAQVVTQLIGGLLGGGVAALLIGDVLGRSAGTVSLGRGVGTAKGWKTVSRSRIAAVAKRYGKFPLLLGPAALINTAGLQLPAILLGAYYGASTAGLYALANRLIATPMKMIGEGIGQVFLAEAARIGRNDPVRLRRLYERTLVKLLAIGGVAIGLVALVGPHAFRLVFGREWASAGSYTQVLAIAYVGQFAVAPLSQTLNILERQDLQLTWDVIRLVLVWSALLVGKALSVQPIVAIGALAAVLCISYGMHAAMCLTQLSKVEDRQQEIVPRVDQ